MGGKICVNFKIKQETSSKKCWACDEVLSAMLMDPGGWSFLSFTGSENVELWKGFEQGSKGIKVMIYLY